MLFHYECLLLYFCYTLLRVCLTQVFRVEQQRLQLIFREVCFVLAEVWDMTDQPINDLVLFSHMFDLQ